MCGCVSGGYVLESNHVINDSLWAINFCDAPDSIITIIAHNEVVHFFQQKKLDS